MLTLETERLRLRNWLESDVGNYMLLSQDVGYNCFSPPGRFLVASQEEARGKIRERIDLFEHQKLGKFPVFLKSTGEFIGTCGVEPFDLEGRTEVELGYRLCLKHWGCGYAQEAAAAILRYGFGALDRARIMAFVLPQNRASVKILENLGLGYLREFMHYDLAHRLYEVTRDRFRGEIEFPV
jgi:[ribosomal protein S5]-alanine N-acetyltransferase